jgi:hypothetical protein
MDTINITNKDQFIENVKKWNVLDAKLKIVNENTKKLRTMKHDCSQQICQYMNKNGLSDKIKMNDDVLQIYEKNTYSPLTFTYIEDSLAKIISNPEQITFIMEYLRTNREVKKTNDIKRTPLFAEKPTK